MLIISLSRFDYLYNEEIGIYNGEQWSKVNEEGVDHNVASADYILAKIVGAASGHITLRDVPEWKSSDYSSCLIIIVAPLIVKVNNSGER